MKKDLGVEMSLIISVAQVLTAFHCVLDKSAQHQDAYGDHVPSSKPQIKGDTPLSDPARSP